MLSSRPVRFFGNNARELYTAVAESNGHMVIDELADLSSDKYECLAKPESKSDTPVHIDIENSRVNLKALECTNSQLKQELIEYLLENRRKQ